LHETKTLILVEREPFLRIGYIKGIITGDHGRYLPLGSR
jgi:hypothetical protein